MTIVTDYLRDDDISPEQLHTILSRALELKAHPLTNTLQGSAVAVIFDKASTRTRLSFDVGIVQLGGHPVIIQSGASQLGRGEPISDTARMFDRQVAAIVWRTYAQTDLEEMAEHASVPVINGLTDEFHPCQVLADLLTISEHRGGLGQLAGQTLAYYGDGSNNMAHSYALGGALAGLHVRICTPASHLLRADVLARAQEIAAGQGGSVTVLHDPGAGSVDADVVVTDTWVSMGQEEAEATAQATFGTYSVTPEVMAAAKPDALFMHCLPAYRGMEVSAEVIDGPQSVVFDEAENRLHAQKALIEFLLAQTSEPAQTSETSLP